jgi:hypothetical protein
VEPIKPPSTPPGADARDLIRQINAFAARADQIEDSDAALQLAVDLFHLWYDAERAWERSMALMNAKRGEHRNVTVASVRGLAKATGVSPYTIQARLANGREQLEKLAGKRGTA